MNSGNRSRRQGAVIALSTLAIVSLSACGDDAKVSTEPDQGASASTTTFAPSTTQLSPSTSVVLSDNVDAIWPIGEDLVAEPVDAARSFAVGVLGFSDPIVGDFKRTGEVAGAVEVRSSERGSATTIELTERLDGGWSVLAATTPSLLPHDVVVADHSVVVTGTSTAFEGTIDVALFDLSGAPALATTFTNGGANGEMGPFRAAFDAVSPATPNGFIVVSTTSAEDGRIFEAATIPVNFG